VDTLTGSDTFFFWITLEAKLDETYYATAAQLNQHGIKLLPIRIDQLAKLSALTNSGHVVVLCSTRHALQFDRFVKEVAPHLARILRQDRLSFFHLSSYKKLDLGAKLYRFRNYFFLTYPLGLDRLCAKLKRYHELRASRAKAWPGGRRARVPGLVS